MRKTFAPLDDMLIERLFQPISDMISYRIGVGRRAAACFCIDVASLSWILSRAYGLSVAVTGWDFGTAFLDLTVLLLGLLALISLRSLFRRAGSRQGNPLRAAMRPHRAIVLMLLAARLTQIATPGRGSAADIAMLAFAASALYLGACTERPPVRRGSASLLPAG